MDIVVDFEAFYDDNNKYIVKELAYSTPDDGRFGSFTFKSPPNLWNFFSSKTVNRNVWVIDNLHGMQWSEGSLPYPRMRELLSAIAAPFPNVFVKGNEKKKFVEDIVGKEVTLLNCPRVDELPALTERNCSRHAINFPHCAISKVLKYGRFMKERGLVNVVRSQKIDKQKVRIVKLWNDLEDISEEDLDDMYLDDMSDEEDDDDCIFDEGCNFDY